jgi:hypothetical protein
MLSLSATPLVRQLEFYHKSLITLVGQSHESCYPCYWSSPVGRQSELSENHWLITPVAFYKGSREDRQRLTDEIRHACEDLGFFQLRNYTIPDELQTAILE